MNDNGDSNEKKKKKNGWEYSGWKFSGGIHQGEFDGWEFSGWEFSWYQEELDVQKKFKLILQKYF